MNNIRHTVRFTKWGVMLSTGDLFLLENGNYRRLHQLKCALMKELLTLCMGYFSSFALWMH